MGESLASVLTRRAARRGSSRGSPEAGDVDVNAESGGARLTKLGSGLELQKLRGSRSSADVGSTEATRGKNVQLAMKLSRVVTEAAARIRSVPNPTVSVAGFFAWLRARYVLEPLHMRIDFHMRWLFPVLFISVHVFMVIFWAVQRLVISHAENDVCYAALDAGEK